MGDEIRNATHELAAALLRGDAPAAAALYAVDGKLLTPAAELVTGREQIEAYWRAGIAFGLAGVELSATDLDVGADLAVEIGRYQLRLEPEAGAAVADRGKYVVLHRRQSDGSWRRVVDVFNPDVPESRPERKEER